MKWFLQNERRGASFVSRNPRYVIRAIFRELMEADKRFLALLSGAKPTPIREYVTKKLATPAVADVPQSAEFKFRGTLVASHSE
jgi:hypothetical protein